jgi:TonB family protein
MHERAERVRRASVTWTASLLVHGALLGGITLAAFANLRHQREAAEAARQHVAGEPIPIELPLANDGTAVSRAVVDHVGDPPVVAGGATIERLDTGRNGRGGDSTSPRATHLSDRDERLHLTPDSISHYDRDQLQRLRTSRTRASWEDHRMTTHPMELTFLASGHGDVPARRRLARTDPSRGALRADGAATLGGDPGGQRVPEGDSYAAKRAVGDARAGTSAASPGTGLHDGRAGTDHRTSASAMYARPELTQGPPNVAATAIDRPRDDVDSNQDVATALRSIVHGSYAGGRDGTGAGGTGGGGAPGAGGPRGEGSHPAPLGVSESELYDIETTDPRLLPYFRRMKAKIDPLWQNAFPRSAIVDLKQGTVILDFTVHKDGSVRVDWPPARPSGIAEFDRNCAAAIRRAAPFEPIPAALGVSELRVRAPFVANNFVVK